MLSLQSRRRFLIPLTVMLILILAATIGTTSSSFLDPEGSSNNTNRVITDWYDIAWGYRKEITISNSGSTLTAYQVKVTIDTETLIDESKMQSDGDDIRFTTDDGSTGIDYWIEAGIDTDSTEIWVEVPSIPSGDSSIYIYYGNGTASAGSSVSDTFTSDTFTDTFTDTSKINTSDSVNVEVSGGEVSLPENSDYSDWVQTTQVQFESGVLNQVDTSASPGDVELETLGAKSVALIVGDPSSPSSTQDVPFYDYINAKTDWSATYLAASPLPDVSGYDVVVICYSVGTGPDFSAWTTLGKPILIQDRRHTDDIALTTGEGGYNNNQTQVEITDNSHYITSPYSLGNLTIASREYFSYPSGVGGDVDVLAIRPGRSDQPYLIEVDKDETLSDNTTPAPERRVYCPPNGYDGTTLNDDGWIIYDRALDWLTGGGYVSSGTIASQVLDTGVDGASWTELSWSETLASGTDITFEVRASDTLFAKDAASPSWTPVGGTSPVTSGLPSGKYMQWRATLSTSDISNTPTLHDATITYYTALGMGVLRSMTIPAGTSTTYDFSSGVEIDKWAWDVDSDSDPPEATPNSEIAATSGEYSAIASSDDVRWQLPDPRVNDYRWVKSKMIINEVVSTIARIDFSGEAYGSVSNTAKIYAYNISTSGWDLVGSGTVPNAAPDATVTGSITANFSDYIDVDGSLIWCFGLADTSDYLYVDYVKVDITKALRLAVGTQLSWTDTEPVNTDVKYQLEYYDGAWALIPDADLAGNSTGFDGSPIDISTVKSTYSQIRLRANLSTDDSIVTPSVQDWTVTYYYREYTSSEPTISDIGGEE